MKHGFTLRHILHWSATQVFYVGINWHSNRIIDKQLHYLINHPLRANADEMKAGFIIKGIGFAAQMAFHHLDQPANVVELSESRDTTQSRCDYSALAAYFASQVIAAASLQWGTDTAILTHALDIVPANIFFSYLLGEGICQSHEAGSTQ